MNIFNIVIWIWTKTRGPILHTILIIKAWFICHCGDQNLKKKQRQCDRCHLIANIMHALCPGELLKQKERVQSIKGQM
jgi:hypothetical protein